MLVLSRRTGERIRIGEDIEVVILSFRGRAVVVGIEAPQDVRIQREELLLRPEPNSDVAPLPVASTAMPREDRVVPGTQPAATGGESLRGPLSATLAGRSTTLARRAVG